MKTPKILKVSDQAKICYFKSDLNYTILYLENGKTYVSGYTIKVFEEIYKNEFIKVNRSDLINVAFIQRMILNDKTYSVQLVNGDEINIARRRVSKIRALYPTMF